VLDVGRHSERERAQGTSNKLSRRLDRGHSTRSVGTASDEQSQRLPPPEEASAYFRGRIAELFDDPSKLECLSRHGRF
jgi:hypothetical protein